MLGQIDCQICLPIELLQVFVFQISLRILLNLHPEIPF